MNRSKKFGDKGDRNEHQFTYLRQTTGIKQLKIVTENFTGKGSSRVEVFSENGENAISYMKREYWCKKGTKFTNFMAGTLA